MSRTAENLLRECIHDLIADALNEDVGFGSTLDAEERAAKERYEAAKAELDAWVAADDEYRKRLSAWESLRAAGKARAKDRPTRPPMLATQKSTLERALQRAEELLAEYDPSIRKYVRSKKPETQKQSAALPDPNTKELTNIDDVKPLRWYEWDARLKKSGVPFGGDAGQGIGPGEEWIARTFGGAVQGASVSYDVVTKDGRTWEIKSIEEGSMIRPGQKGRIEIERPRKKLENIIKQIKNFVTLFKKIDLDRSADEDVRMMLAHLAGFIDDDYDAIVGKGEISYIKLKSIRAAIKTATALRNKFVGDKKLVDKEHDVELNGKNVKLDNNTYIDVAKRVQRAVPDVDIISELDEIEIAFAALKDPAFSNPSEFFNEWYRSINVENVFGETDGMFIVTKNGYYMIPKTMLSKVLKFYVVSQGLPRFKFLPEAS